MRLPEPLAYGIIIVVTVVWVVNFAATVLIPGYSDSIQIHLLFGTIVGASFALKRDGNRSGGTSP